MKKNLKTRAWLRWENRERGDALETFKTINGFNRVDKDKWFQFEKETARPTRSNTAVTNEGERRRLNVIRGESARLEVRKNFYNVRAGKKWNEIPDNVKEQKSVNAFKNAYDKWASNSWLCDEEFTKEKKLDLETKPNRRTSPKNCANAPTIGPKGLSRGATTLL